METPQVIVPSGSDDAIPLMGTLESKFLAESDLEQGIQFPKLKKAGEKRQPQKPQIFQPEMPKKKKKRKKKKIFPEVATPQPLLTPPSAKKKVSFSPRIVSNVGYTYSKQEYDRTPIMGIFNHFCDSCMEGIEGARFHCQLCQDFDMCQSCFVSQGATHIHGQQAFSCPELDELELGDEGDEGDENDFDFINEYLASLDAGEGCGAEEEDEDHSLDDLSFRFVDHDGDAPGFPQPESIRLADENGPLERITSEEAAELEAEETPIKLLFPKIADSIPIPTKTKKKKSAPQELVTQKAKKKNKTGPLQSTSSNQKTKGSSESAILRKKSSKVQKTEGAPLDPQKLLKKKKKKKKKNAENGVPLAQPSPPKKQKKTNGASPTKAATISSVLVDAEEEAPLRLMLQKLMASDPNASFFSPTKKSPKKAKTERHEVHSPHLTDNEPQAQKRARADGSSPKVKKQKLASTFEDQDF